MKKILLLTSVAFFSLALSEPQPITENERRVRVVTWRDGMVIKAVASPGQAFSLELPKGLRFYDSTASEQTVMNGGGVADDPSDRTARTATETASGRKEECITQSDLRTCIKFDRFVYFIPINPLMPQPVHLLAYRERPGLPLIEYQFIVELSTGPDHYYGVRVEMPAPPPAPISVGVRRPAARRAYMPAEPVAPPVAVPQNGAYSITGDRSLLGEPGR